MAFRVLTNVGFLRIFPANHCVKKFLQSIFQEGFLCYLSSLFSSSVVVVGGKVPSFHCGNFAAAGFIQRLQQKRCKGVG